MAAEPALLQSPAPAAPAMLVPGGWTGIAHARAGVRLGLSRLTGVRRGANRQACGVSSVRARFLSVLFMTYDCATSCLLRLHSFWLYMPWSITYQLPVASAMVIVQPMLPWRCVYCCLTIAVEHDRATVRLAGAICDAVPVTYHAVPITNFPALCDKNESPRSSCRVLHL